MPKMNKPAQGNKGRQHALIGDNPLDAQSLFASRKRSIRKVAVSKHLGFIQAGNV